MNYEQKYSEDEKIRRWIIDDIRYNMNIEFNNSVYKKKAEKAIAWLEKLGEQKAQGKSALEEKVEPKFKVGDWIIGNRNTFKITQYEDEYGYELTDITGCVIHFVSPDYVESNYHLWTIADAKDGDVLYSIDSKQPFIYKERPQFSQARGYCCINKFGEFAIWNTSKCVICTDKYIPATKEQRDLLFQKIHESGYEWDAGKKELKKIEKKPAKLSEEDEQIILSIEQVMNCASLLNIVPEKIDKIKSWLKSLKQRIGG